MGMREWLRSIIGGKGPRTPKAGPPTEAELQAARDRLDQMVKPAIFGELGGETAPRDNQIASWWGGYFFGAAGETAPVCQGTGRLMRPLVQIRMDALPEIPACFAGLALLNIWIDLKAVFAEDDGHGAGFVIRTYSTLDGLVPIGADPSERKPLPILPILWRGPVPEQPTWDEFASEVPESVAQADDDRWFFESRNAAATEALYETCPVKLGGWPNWIQFARWPDDAEFCFQVDSTDKGKFNIGDAGSLYIFRTPRGWVSRMDCY